MTKPIKQSELREKIMKKSEKKICGIYTKEGRKYVGGFSVPIADFVVKRCKDPNCGFCKQWEENE